MEDNMKLSTISFALCFALAPMAAHAAAQDHHPVHHMQRHVIPMTATAFVPTVKIDDDSDGLTRNREECNRGCIDSN
jgi:hypothetical protein